MEPSLQDSFISTVENFTFLPWEKFWEQVLLVLLFPILLWYSLQDQLLSLAGLSTRLDFFGATLIGTAISFIAFRFLIKQEFFKKVQGYFFDERIN